MSMTAFAALLLLAAGAAQDRSSAPPGAVPTAAEAPSSRRTAGAAPMAPETDPALQAGEEPLARIERLQRDAQDTRLPMEVRRRSADALLEALRQTASEHAGTAREPIWLADGAEACFVTVLRLGGDLDTVLLSLPAHEEWQRVGATIALMLDSAERAAAAAPRAVARLSDPAAAFGPEERALLDRLETIEIPLRIPLLVGLSQTLAGVVIDAVPEARRERGRTALGRLLPVLPELDGEALRHAALAAMIAAGLADDPESLRIAWTTARDAARGDPAAALRVELHLALAESLRGDLAAATDRLRRLASAAAPPGDPERPRRLAEFQARLHRDSGAPGAEWVAPLRSAVDAAPRGRRIAWRDSVLARLADLSASVAEEAADEPLLELARAQALARKPDHLPAASEAVLRAIAGMAPEDPWRPAALHLAASIEVRLERLESAARLDLELADHHRADPRATEAIERAIATARVLDDREAIAELAVVPAGPLPASRGSNAAGQPGTAGGSGAGSSSSADGGSIARPETARGLLRHALEVGCEHFPDHPRRTEWRLERTVIDVEAFARRGDPDDETRRVVEGMIADSRAALRSLAGEPRTHQLRARQALALADLALAADRADDALAALDMAMVPGSDAPPTLALPLLARRMLALSLLDRDLLADPMLSASRPAMEPVLLGAMPLLLEHLAPALAPGEFRSSDPRRRAATMRVAALAESLVESTRVDPAEADALRRRMADSLRASGSFDSALAIYDSLLQRHPDRADLLLGAAECLAALAGATSADGHAAPADQDRLGRAIHIYQRLIADRELPADPAQRDDLWWLCQLRQLQCHRRAGADRERIAARLERLAALDPALGGPRFAPSLDSLRRALR